jgi:hypothetical protein
VVLEVQNAFGSKATRLITVERPKIDKSGATDEEQMVIDASKVRARRPPAGAPSGAPADPHAGHGHGTPPAKVQP